jgi:hypothetical protein
MCYYVYVFVQKKVWEKPEHPEHETPTPDVHRDYFSYSSRFVLAICFVSIFMMALS